jgi:hypothetical protein
LIDTFVALLEHRSTMNIDAQREQNQQVIVPVSLSRRENHGAGSFPRPTLIETFEQDAVEGSSDADNDALEIAGPEAGENLVVRPPAEVCVGGPRCNPCRQMQGAVLQRGQNQAKKT